MYNKHTTCYRMSIFELPCGKQGAISSDLKKNIWMSFEHTGEIAKVVEHENWGKLNRRLHSYLDYTFRARIIDRQLKLYHLQDGKTIGLFNTGLNTRNSHEYIYLVFKTTQDTKTKKQPYTLPCFDNVGEYCMTKDEIVMKYSIDKRDIPNKVNWHRFPESRVNFDYDFYLKWDNIFKKVLNSRVGGNTRNILIRGFKANNVQINTSRMRQELTGPFIRATSKSLYLQSRHHNHVRPGLYLKRNSYDICLQLLLNVEYPKFSGVYTKFGVVLVRNEDYGTYEFDKLLSIEMIHKNGRLIGRLPKLWEFESEDVDDNKEVNVKLQSLKVNIPDTKTSDDTSPIEWRCNSNSSSNSSSKYSYNIDTPQLTPIPSLSEEDSVSTVTESSDSNDNNFFIPVFTNTEKVRIITVFDNNTAIETIIDKTWSSLNYFIPVHETRETNFINLKDFEFKNELLRDKSIMFTTKSEICQFAVDQCVQTTIEIRNFDGSHSIKSFLNKSHSVTGQVSQSCIKMW